MATESASENFVPVHAYRFRRVMRPGGQLRIADWGRPSDPLMRLLSRPIALLDGKEQTKDNPTGRLPNLIAELSLRPMRPDRL